VGRNFSSEIDEAMAAAAAEVEDGPPKGGPKRKLPNAAAPSGMPRASTGANIPAVQNTDGRSGARKLPTAPPPSASEGELPPRGLSYPGSAPAKRPPTQDLLSSGSLPGVPRGALSSVNPATPQAPSKPVPPAPSIAPRGLSTTPVAAPKSTMSGGSTPSKLDTLPPQLRGMKLAQPKRPEQSGAHHASKIAMIDYAPDDSLIDHKGRSRPLYKPRTPRPDVWRPSKPVRVLLGLFPGTRVMALENAKAGLPYAILGMLSLIGALFMVIGWSRTEATLRALLIDERWMIVHGSALVVLLFLFEIMRLASFFEERTAGLKVPRVLAAFLLPAIATLMIGPDQVAMWPQLVESAWFAALVLALGAIAGSVWCAFDGTLQTPRARNIFRAIGLAIIVGLSIAAVLTNTTSKESLKIVAAVSHARGFRTLPDILAALI
jgi:hypothetical protein